MDRGGERWKQQEARTIEDRGEERKLENVSELGVGVLGHALHAVVSRDNWVGWSVLLVARDVGSPHVESEEAVADG